jgi:hypothetical protein
MIELLKGVPVVKSVQGVAAATSVDLQPGAGEQWMIAWAQGSHDDNGGARVIGFQLHDGTTSVNMGPGVSAVNGICIPFAMTNPDGVAGKSGGEWAVPLILNEKMHLTLAGVGIGAGKHLLIEALVYVFKGAGTWVEPL